MTKAAGTIYYTVITRDRMDDDDAPFEIHFGSYDQEEAREEAFEATQCGELAAIVVSGDTQAEIDAAVADFNSAL